MRASRLNSLHEGFHREMKNLESRLIRRGYKQSEIEKNLSEIGTLREDVAAPYFGPCKEVISTVDKESTISNNYLKIPLFFTNDNKDLVQIFSKNWSILKVDSGISEMVSEKTRFLYKNRKKFEDSPVMIRALMNLNMKYALHYPVASVISAHQLIH